MNKKATFVPLLMVVTLLVLGTLAYTVLNLNKDYQENINLGEKSLDIIKTYNEAEKSQFYLEQAAHFSKELALKTINENMGYSKPCTSVSLATILWNDCPPLNVENNFEGLLEKNLEEYLQDYESYSGVEYKFFPSFSAKYLLHMDYTNLIKNIKIESIKKENNNLIVTFKPATYFIKGHTEQLPKKYTTQFIIETDYPDFSIYYKIYNTAQNCNTNNKDECLDSIKMIDSSIQAQFTTNTFIKVTYKDIVLNIDTSRQLQPVGNLFTA